mmetsp:Transcript_7942/g.18102  ORF Transcript_7942/g.18102 Transcript_7942/m.18102 type:complete len:225 (-) Transcript_7942:140-814(-)
MPRVLPSFLLPLSSRSSFLTRAVADAWNFSLHREHRERFESSLRARGTADPCRCDRLIESSLSERCVACPSCCTSPSPPSPASSPRCRPSFSLSSSILALAGKPPDLELGTSDYSPPGRGKSGSSPVSWLFCSFSASADLRSRCRRVWSPHSCPAGGSWAAPASGPDSSPPSTALQTPGNISEQLASVRLQQERRTSRLETAQQSFCRCLEGFLCSRGIVVASS